MAGQAYTQAAIPLLARTSPFTAHHDYTKSLNTTTAFSRLTSLITLGRPAIGSTSRLSLALLLNEGFGVTYEKFDKDDLNLKFETGTHPEWMEIPGDIIIYGDGLLQRNSVLMKTTDWEAVDVAESIDRPASFRLVNYIQATPERSDEYEPYYSLGHFQPITQDILNETNFVYDEAGSRTHFEFNSVEVWGGDAHVGLFDFTRIYPFPSDQCEKHDYSLSHILPIESKYNLMLRPGRTFARSAVRPEETSCDNTGEQFLNGIMHQQPEDWNYNKVLLVDTSAVSYGVQPRDFLPVIEQPSGFCWSPVKQSGQLLDNWRMRLAGDAGQGDGSMGAITKLIKSESQGLYAWHSHGVELLPLEPMNLQATDTGTILTSSGAVFHQGIPISRKYGTVHPDSVWSHAGQMGAWDARMGVLLRHDTGGLDLLSQSENLTDLIETLTLPLSAGSDVTMSNWTCFTGVDSENGDVWITLCKVTGQAHTLGYSTKLRVFVGEYDAYPALYGNRGRLLLSVNPANPHQLWANNRGQYGQFYGSYFPTLLRFIVNVQPTQNKTFTNGHILVNVGGWPQITKVTHWTPNGGEAQRHILTPHTDDRFSYHRDCLQYPAHEWNWDESKERLRGHYQTVELEIANDESNTPAHIMSYKTIFRSA
ncbi:hypothetical protein HMF3257_00330 [Spirosoma telluris]|uniref:Uncharacterized protein n=1 Tax=Spirosoma telluris TaxID=2183553 RepID=A0A327NDS9_9BACT|nr:hypothetical protein HMF3257_00330 [Spirosoma telluris]